MRWENANGASCSRPSCSAVVRQARRSVSRAVFRPCCPCMSRCRQPRRPHPRRRPYRQELFTGSPRRYLAPWQPLRHVARQPGKSSILRSSFCLWARAGLGTTPSPGHPSGNSARLTRMPVWSVTGLPHRVKRWGAEPQPSIWLKSAISVRVSPICASRRRRLRRRAGSGSLTVTTSKNRSSTGRRDAAAIIASAKRSRPSEA